MCVVSTILLKDIFMSEGHILYGLDILKAEKL